MDRTASPVLLEIRERVKLSFCCGRHFVDAKSENELKAYKCPECGAGKIIAYTESAPRTYKLVFS